ncbi:NYN domain-containing protein [Variovorax sp. RKNM96]|uniref:PIN domain-containing protein n=1 Tax=Variovorax sp. RKNM96 TaxID=2681552 RepID=UPI0019827281|nr:PIN domain-containing protein [Variovorax sp. RKNM96]QSI33314.1 NYN domain-containing protein [Variovorax sp. RKNM96]
MTKTYLLIDLQNRQPAPEHVASWMGANGEAWIFYGEHEIGQLAQYMELGDRVSLVDISKPGKNSLDFHLVLYLGYLVGRHEPGARFVIVAADGDYDPAVVHARSKGQQVERVEVLGPTPVKVESEPFKQSHLWQTPTALRPLAGKAIESTPLGPSFKKLKSVDQISAEILKDFVEAGKPKTLSALEKRIQWRFGPDPVPEKVAGVLAVLVTVGVIWVSDGSLEYRARSA